MLERLSLDGKTVVVTGGGTGLGRAMALALAQAGANLVLAGRRLAPLEETAAQAAALGREALALSIDVSDSAQVNRLVAATLERFGRVDALVNNAALLEENVRKPIWEVTDAEWNYSMSVNLNGAFYCARAVARPMAEQGGGKIINIASGFGLRGGRDLYTYCVSKGGVIQLTRTLAFSLARYGITANTIAPGFIPTQGAQSMGDALPNSGDFLPVGKLGKPQDLGPIAVFLASSASDYMTGEIFIVDGGGLAGGVTPTGYAPVAGLEP